MPRSGKQNPESANVLPNTQDPTPNTYPCPNTYPGTESIGMLTTRRSKIAALALIASMSCGCHQSHTRTQTTAGQTTGVASDTVVAEAAMPDLSKPFHASQEMGESWLAPLNFARFLGSSAGGTWVSFAPTPLDDVKWQRQTNPYGGGASSILTVQQTLDALRKAGTPVSYKMVGDTMVMDYGPPTELDQTLKQPPTETVGVFVRAANIPAMLRAVSTIFHIDIQASPELIQQFTNYSTARKKLEDLEKEDAADGQAAATYTGGYMNGGPISPEQLESNRNAVEFKAVKRLNIDGLVMELAHSLGGTLKVNGNAKWQISIASDPKEISAEIDRLKGIIDQEAGATANAFSSFASRSGASPDADTDENQQEMPITPMGEESQRAFESLGRLGKPAMPTLIGYLVPEKPSAALGAVKTLDILATPEAKDALVDFEKRLQAPPKDPISKMIVPQLQADLIVRIGRNPNAAALKLLGDIALSNEAGETVKTAARMVLAGAGNLTPFQSTSASKPTLSGEFEFELREPPAGSGLQPMRNEKSNNRRAIPPLAVTKSSTGEDWAVFVSGRLGNNIDLWLARGQGGKWVEFLFTGHLYARNRQYGQDTPPKPGACRITVTGDKIVIGPPGKDNSAELAQIMKQFQDPKLSMELRNKISVRYQQLNQSQANVMAKTITLSLADLRKDSDGDGLTDVVETRLGLDPHKADTNGDGVTDSKDPNPLTPPIKSQTDRNRILQTIFTALFGGDQASDPIVVILDKASKQPFNGAHARVLCLTPDEYALQSRHLSSLRVLQFGGPKDATSTILTKDGPCLFNETHTRVEVHFWQSRPEGGNNNFLSSRAMMMQPVVDYTAIFEKHDGEWKLARFKPSHFETSSSAMSRANMGVYVGDGDE